MKSCLLLALLGVMLFLGYAQAGCDDAPKDADDGEVAAWFKNLGCKIQKGAGDLQDSAKPWVDKIGTSAKDFGNTVAQKYDEVKHKLTDDDAPSTVATTIIHNAPTEKVPLAPLSGDVQPSIAPVPVPAPGAAAAAA